MSKWSITFWGAISAGLADLILCAFTFSTSFTDLGKKVNQIGRYYGDVSVGDKTARVYSSPGGFPYFSFDINDTCVTRMEKPYFPLIPFVRVVTTKVEVKGLFVEDPEIIRQAKDLSYKVLDATIPISNAKREADEKTARAKATKDLYLK